MNYAKDLHKSIAHHIAMRGWAAKQAKTRKITPNQAYFLDSITDDQDDWHSYPEIRRMDAELGETPNAEHCALCKSHIKKKCKECPLAMVFSKCSDDNSVWQRITYARTWGQFVKAEDAMIFLLRILLGGIVNARRKSI